MRTSGAWLLVAAMIAGACGIASLSEATTIGTAQFVLNDGNAGLNGQYPNGTVFGTIDLTLDDNGTASVSDNTVKFTVTSSDPTKYTFAKEFGFNIADDDIAGIQLSSVTSGWGWKSGDPSLATVNIDGFGGFELALNGPNPSSAVASFTFTLTRTNGFASLDPLIDQLTSGGEGATAFVQHVVLVGTNCDGSACTGYSGVGATAVPEPSALLLLGSGLIGAGVMIRSSRYGLLRRRVSASSGEAG